MTSSSSRVTSPEPEIQCGVTFRQIEMTQCEDENSDDDVIVTSGDVDKYTCDDVIGLFDVVKRDFRCETAKIRNRPKYEEPDVESENRCDRNRMSSPSNPKLSFVKEMKRKVSISLELKNKGVEELQMSNYRNAMKYFHHSLLYLKGLDPDEGVDLNEGEMWERKSLRKMPQKLKEIKENTEIDNYLNLAVCLMHKPKPPYEKIKEYSIRILNLQHDHVKALMRAGMACFHLNEMELSKFYLQSAQQYSHDATIGRIHCHHCKNLYKPLTNHNTSP